ncbi:TPA: tetratricopeptide repeat protein, partial [Escherichia coli]|nr:tetratricopeptide repeat protein [Escherichia coli]
MVYPFLQVQNMTGKLRFEVNDNQGCFIFPETWFGSLLDEFEELIDAYDA